jgi:hypothetical protein
MHFGVQSLIISPSGSNKVEAAVAFWKALKVYPQPADLIGIYDKVRYRIHSL